RCVRMTRENEQDASRARALHKLRTRGLEAAVDALISVAEDKKAPANSRAQAGSSLVRANGLFATTPNDTPKDPHEMTAAELKAHAAQLERDRDALLAEMEKDGGEDDV